MDWSRIDAALFDLDGVLTPTALVHRAAWSQMFNAFLADERGQAPYTDDDYFAHVDGKPRYDGVRDFLTSRGISLPEGDPSDGPDDRTVHGLGNRKNDEVNLILDRDGVQAYPGSLALLEILAARGTAMAVVSSSQNAPTVLRSAGIDGYFPVVVDGSVAKEVGLPGKPAHDTFTYAAARLGVPTGRCVVVEDAVSGIQAGAAGDFAWVLGVDRGAGAQVLRDAGADEVVGDLEEVLP